MKTISCWTRVLGRGTATWASAIWVAALLAGGMTAATGADPRSLTYVDLVKRLTDLQRLAEPPDPGEACRQWSSYDRASRQDPGSGRYLGWDANGDGDGFIRREGDRIVMAEMEGPGCLWRIWSAAPKEGRVRIYLDGASEPAVDLPFAGYFDGRQAPFDRPALVHTVALGCNNYTPIPFAKSCKVVADPGWGQYFQFVYSTFAPGTRVPTFSRRLSAAENAALDEANQRLLACGPQGGEETRWRTLAEGILAPGQSREATLEGAQAIVGLRARLEDLPAPPADRIALREVTLEMRWDGKTEPSVWAPFADFFGTAAGAHRYRSLPAGLTEDGWWYANWYMPFARGAAVVLRNDGQEPRRVRLDVATSGPHRDPATLGRFHAKWHRDAFPPPEPERRAIDWTLLRTTGRGRFAGVMLHVWNPRGSWWGEGDEKFYVDGEKFPSTFGTGSEDYFGYAWCSPILFQNAYHNQTVSMNNRGHISVNRWHVADNLPFQTQFEAAIEKYFPNERPTLYAATVFWYQQGGSDPYRPVPVHERAGYWDDTMLATRHVKGALEGERLRAVRASGGQPQEQDMSGFGPEWSGDAQLWWIQGRPGDRLELEVPVARDGRYRVIGQFTKAIDYGQVQLNLDGVNLGGALDFYHDGVVATGPLDLGVCPLKAGDHRLIVEILGANERAVKGYMFGLDYLRLEAVP